VRQGGWNEGVPEWSAERVTGDWRKLQDGVLQYVSSPNIIRIIIPYRTQTKEKHKFLS
jgi:hypothetical protein